MKKRFLGTVLGMSAGLYVNFCPPVFAYLDPGSGSYFYQILLSLLLAIPFFFRHIFAKISDFFRMIFKRKSGPGPTE